MGPFKKAQYDRALSSPSPLPIDTILESRLSWACIHYKTVCKRDVRRTYPHRRLEIKKGNNVWNLSSNCAPSLI